MNNPRSFSAYQLKWLAIMTMTIDHFGVLVLLPFAQTESIATLYLIARLIGRLAFPLFGFMIAEGIYRSKKPIQYIARIALMGLFIGIAMFLLGEFGIQTLSGNIFIDLTMAALAMYLLKQQHVLIRFLALIPIFYVMITSFTNQFPNYLSADYGFYGLVMMILFFLSYQKLPTFFYQLNPFKFSSTEFTIEQKRYQMASVIFILMHILWYIISLVLNDGLNLSGPIVSYINRFVGAQTYAVFAAYFIYHYRGVKGSTPKWFQVFTYLYYPLHFVALYAIYYLVSL
ncbi:MAG: hypothetical protein RL379_829 [Bacillota bacterium]|jgi:hypothetical protein